jgi:putative membrane protein
MQYPAMYLLSDILVLVVAAQHAFFLILEMFLWTRPLGLKIFRNTPADAEKMKVLAANQGLYNGFLAAGLVWAVWIWSDRFSFDTKMFFLGCVNVAALYGGYSVSRRILVIQGLPALIAVALTIAFANPYLEVTDCCKPAPATSATTTQ